MSVLEHETPELETEPSEEEVRDEAIAEALVALRPEPDTGEPEQEAASTDASLDAPPEDEAPETTPEQEPSQETEEERELRQARVIAKELRERPELGDALVAIKQGRASLIDREVLEAAQQFMAANQPDIQAEPDDFEEKFWSDPIAVLREIKGKTEQFESWQTQQSQLRAQAEYRSNADLLTTVGEEWQSSHPGLSEDHIAQITATAGEANLIARRLAKHGDKTRAIREGLEDAFRLEFPELAQQAVRNEAVRDANRKRRAGATAASPRSMPRRSEEPTPPRNSAERVEFLADLIREQDAAQQ